MATSVEYPTTSDDEESIEDEKTTSGSFRNGDYQGRLFKWTNYLHGWQERYLILKHGFLNYYKNEYDIGLGCRGALAVNQVIIQVNVLFSLRKDRGRLMFVFGFSLMNLMNVDLIFVLVIRCGIYVHIDPKIVNDGFKLLKITNKCVRVNQVMVVKRVYDDIQVWVH